MHKQKVTRLGSRNLHFHKSDLDGVYDWPQNRLNGVGALRGQWHIPSKY